MLKRLRELKDKPMENVVMRLLAAWCVSSSVLCLLTPGLFSDLENYKDVPFWAAPLGVAAAFGVFTALRCALKKESDRVVLPCAFAAYALLTVFLNPDWYYAFLLTALWAVLVFHYRRRGYFSPPRPFSREAAVGVVVFCAALFLIVVGAAGVFKHLAYRTPNYDFGIFCQMFYSMKTKLAPLTTCERDRLLSHFAVHISPVFYLLLPVYALFSSPVTLQLAQTVILASAVVPILLLCRRFALGPYKTGFTAALFLLYPAVACGTNYDFHENCFLLPFLLWTFYFFECGRMIPMAVFSLLTLTVKEDAAVYLIFFALFIILDRRKPATGIILALCAAAYFCGALLLLSRFGDGVMESRYKNFIVADGGLAEAVRNVLADPGYAILQLLDNGHGSAAEKLLFLFQLFVPLAFLPFCVKKVSRLSLLFPLLLLNLLTVYRYQYDIGYQYAFGTSAFLFYLCVLNLRDLREDTAKQIFAVGVFCGVLCFITGPVARLNTQADAYFSRRQTVTAFNEALREIPADASVCCSTFFLPHLSKRDTLYEMEYHVFENAEKPEYVLLDCRYDYETQLARCLAEGYGVSRTVFAGDKPVMLILTPGGEEASP